MKEKLIILILAFISLSIWIIYTNQKNHEENLNIEFNGVVDSVSYDIKGIPTLTINRVDYRLNVPRFDFQIEKGDTFIKFKGNTHYKLIKRQTGKIIRFY
jgi:hypothetical protein